MGRLFTAVLFVASSLAACGGSAPEPESAAGASEPEPAPAPAEPAAAPASTAGGDAWEGESEAKQSDDGAAPAPARPAPNPDVVETRTLEVIQKLIKDNRKPVRDCYEQARKELPSLQGDMIIHFVLDPDGKVKHIELNQQRSTLKAPAVVDCAIKTIKGIPFPASSRGMETTVNYPYNFTP